MNRKGQATLYLALLAPLIIILTLFGGAGVWGLFKVILAPIGGMGPIGIFFIAMLLILILKRR